MPPDLALLSTLTGSNYPCLELISMVPKMFEPLKFDCITCTCSSQQKQKTREGESMQMVTKPKEHFDQDLYCLIFSLQLTIVYGKRFEVN